MYKNKNKKRQKKNINRISVCSTTIRVLLAEHCDNCVYMYMDVNSDILFQTAAHLHYYFKSKL